jgi:hypothetical protein
MQFFGAFSLLVLPLFLLICIRMIQKGEFGKTFFGKVLVVLFYINIAFALGLSWYLFSNL